MPILTEHRVLRPKEHNYINISTSMAQGTSRKMGWKDCKQQNTRNSAVKYSFIEVAA